MSTRVRRPLFVDAESALNLRSVRDDLMGVRLFKARSQIWVAAIILTRISSLGQPIRLVEEMDMKEEIEKRLKEWEKDLIKRCEDWSVTHPELPPPPSEPERPSYAKNFSRPYTSEPLATFTKGPRKAEIRENEYHLGAWCVYVDGVKTFTFFGDDALSKASKCASDMINPEEV
jgi:hypothetical protein